MNRRGWPGIGLAVLAAVLVAAARAADAQPAPGAATARRAGETTAEELSPQALEALTRAGKVGSDGDRDEFLSALRRATEAFSVVTPSLEPGTSDLQPFMLNTEGQGVDGLVFDVPAGEPRDLFWVFVKPRDMVIRWYITPASPSSGGQPRFASYQPLDGVELRGMELPQGSLIVVQASVANGPGTGLVSGQKYILWIDFGTTDPVQFHVAICLPPRGTGVDHAGSMARMLGLKVAAIHDASRLGLLDQIAEILDADPTAIDARISNGEAPLHRTIYWNEPEAAELLVARGADVNAQTNAGLTPLHVAIRQKNMRIVKLLAERGADVRLAGGDGLNALHTAAQVGLEEALEPLLAAGADPGARSADGLAALHIAAREGHQGVVKALLAGGLSVGVPDAAGRTPLHAAAARGKDAMIAFLVAQGAAVDARDDEGRTPVWVAADAGYERAVKTLVKLGATDTPPASEWVDLLKLVDPSRDAVWGEWELRRGELVSDDLDAARISFPYEPPEEYDFAVDFTVSSTYGGVVQMLSRGARAFNWNMNGGRDWRCRIEDIGGYTSRNNPTRVDYDFEPGVRYHSVVRVRKLSVTCLVNDEVLADYETDFSELSRGKTWSMPKELQLGIGTSYGPTTFHRAVVRPAK